MAVIGLYDWDLCTWKTPIVFNLELMKLAYYHKVHCHDVVQMTKTLNTDLCTKLYVRKDYEDYLYPEEVTANPKIILDGLAVHDGLYVPMAPEIECCPADTSIYSNCINYYSKNQEVKRIFNTLNKALHLRLTFDGKTPFPNWQEQLKINDNPSTSIIFHDKALIPTDDIRRAILDISLHYGRRNVRLGMKYPVHIFTPDQLLSWGKYEKLTSINNIYLMDLMPNDVLFTIRKTTQNLTYLINNQNWTYEKFIDNLPKIFMQAMFLSQHSIAILLKIDKDFYLEKEWHQFINLFNAYIRSCLKYHETLCYCCFVYCKHCHSELDRENKIALFKYIKQMQPELFHLLYNVEYAEYANGEFKPHMFTHGEFYEGGGSGGFFYRKTNQRKNRPERLNYADLVQPNFFRVE